MTEIDPARSTDAVATASGPLKCVIWDLDETIWCGRMVEADPVALRDGVRDAVAELDGRGVLQSIASANFHDQAWPTLEAFGLAEYFVVPQIHWRQKHQSVGRIIKLLDLRDSDVAFIDDDPLERGLVAATLPGVTVFDSVDVGKLLAHPRLEPKGGQATVGRDRRALVAADLRRSLEEGQHATLVEFLQTCELRFHGRLARCADLERVVELTQRTNRMNTTGIRMDRSAIATAIDEDQIRVASLRDRFGDYGTVAAAIVKRRGEDVVVDGMWMSCRAGRRGLPDAFFTFLADEAIQLGARTLRIPFRRTPENRVSALHLGAYGFNIRSRTPTSEFSLELPGGIRKYSSWISIE